LVRMGEGQDSYEDCNLTDRTTYKYRIQKSECVVSESVEFVTNFEK
jgi:hypothetical protein